MRFFSLVALLSTVLVAQGLAQGSFAPHALEPRDPREATLFVSAPGDTTNIVPVQSRSVSLDSTVLSKLSTAALEIVPAPGDGRFLVPVRFVLEREGTVDESYNYQTDGMILPVVAVTNQTGGFIPFLDSIYGGSVAKTIADAQWLDIFLGIDASVALFTSLPVGNRPIRTLENAPIKLLLSTVAERSGMNEKRTWSYFVDKVHREFRLRVTVYYQVYER